MRKSAFTLTELIVVIAIIGLLSAIVAPAYREYTVRSNVAGLFQIQEDFQRRVMISYMTTGDLPSAITFPSAINAGNGDEEFATGVNWTRCTVQDNGIDGVFIVGYYDGEAIGLPPNPNNGGGAYALRSAAFIGDGGLINTYCGGWEPGDPNDLPAAYHPSNCTYENMHNANSCIVPSD